jgi:hypothetical protein
MTRKVVILATVLLAFASAASASSIVLTGNPAAQIKTLGQQATVTIDSSTGFVGDFDLNISWDSAIVSLFDIDYGTQLGGPGNSLQNPFVFGGGTVNASEISLLSAAALMALQPGQTATLLTLVFNTLAVGTTAVNIAVVALGDEIGLPHDQLAVVPASITVIDGGPAPVPEPGSMMLLVTGLGWLARRRVKTFLRR